MHCYFRLPGYLAIALIGLMLTALPARADTVRVLILNSYDGSTVPYSSVRTAFMTEMQRHSQAPVVFWQFDLQQRGSGNPSNQNLTAELLRNRYADTPPDLVVAIGPPAIAFWLAHRDEVFGEMPFIAAAGREGLMSAEFRNGDAVIVTKVSFAEMVAGILQVLPGTRHILMVFGASDHERRLAALANAQLEGTSNAFRLEFTNELTLLELRTRLADLHEGSVVFYGVLDSDVSGLLLGGHAGLEAVRKASDVPVFGAFEDQLGLGIVGGRLMQLNQIGREVAVVAEQVLRERPTDVTWAQVDLSEPVYDWRELQAWNIDLDRLPPASAIRFQPVSPWKRYSEWIALTVLIIVAQFLLVSALLVQRHRRRLAEKRNSSLSKRLISSHEDEHRRIANELHDDVSQRLARLSLDAGYLVSHQGSEDANEVLRGMWAELVRVSKDIHDMCYRLHPSLVDDLGIAAALHTECERIRQRSGIAIIENISNMGKGLPHDTALCLYRIAQEALSNAIRHAKAEMVEIRLEPVDPNLVLTVRDNGRGFDPTSASAGHGLGLSSMNERAELVNGSLIIRSKPGEGTTIIATLPMAESES